MWYSIEYFADCNPLATGKVYGEVHDWIDVWGQDTEDAEERAAARLREVFSERFTVVGPIGVSRYCLGC